MLQLRVLNQECSLTFSLLDEILHNAMSHISVTYIMILFTKTLFLLLAVVKTAGYESPISKLNFLLNFSFYFTSLLPKSTTSFRRRLFRRQKRRLLSCVAPSRASAPTPTLTNPTASIATFRATDR